MIDGDDGGPSPDGLPPLREVIRSLSLTANKRLGQNFILDLNLTRRIARLSAPLEAITVVEVGAGPGGLTRALLIEGAHHVVAVERDTRCKPALEAIAERYPGRLSIHLGDALDVNWRELLAPHPVAIIVANLPYNIATKLLIQWLEAEPWPPWWQRMSLMFQKEVAERIVGEPGTKAYGRLAVIAQWRTRARVRLTLGREAFTPSPAVASAVVEFLPRPAPDPACRATTLGRVTAAAFGQRRKMLRQSLKSLVPDPAPLLAMAEVAAELRAEHLAVADFARIARCLDKHYAV
jgi:16S rRNA (adenine1518-N6/adenine1519-N6)-dimethyltransferase